MEQITGIGIPVKGTGCPDMYYVNRIMYIHLSAEYLQIGNICKAYNV